MMSLTSLSTAAGSTSAREIKKTERGNAVSNVEVISTAFGVVGSVCAIVFAYLAFRRNNKTDDEAEGKKDGVLLTEIGYIKSGVDDIKRKQEKEDERHVEVVSRLTAVESSAKQAHKRLDRLEGKARKEEE